MSCPSPHIRFGQKCAPREVEVIGHMAMGLCDKRIAEAMGITRRTVHFHVTNATRRLGAKTRPHLILIAVRNGIVVPNPVAKSVETSPAPTDGLRWRPGGRSPRTCLIARAMLSL